MLPFVLQNLNTVYLERMEVMLEAATLFHSNDESNAFIIANSSLVNGPFFNKHVALRATVGITCCLSMLGAILIIASYFLMRDIRTKSRQILMQLSFADFGVACANFIGVSVYFDQYIRWCPQSLTHKYEAPHGLEYWALYNNHSALSCRALLGLCKAQAFFAGFSTLASVLWTLCLAVYIYCLVVHSSKRAHHKVLYVSYVLCWGIPLFISLWLISTGTVSQFIHYPKSRLLCLFFFRSSWILPPWWVWLVYAQDCQLGR